VALWLAVLSVLSLLLVRQVGILTARQVQLGIVSEQESHLVKDSFSVADDGPTEGSMVSETAMVLLPELAMSNSTVLFFSSSCVPCRELASKLGHHQKEIAGSVALVSGPDELAQAIANLLPKNFRVVGDPVATKVAGLLNIHSAPFGVYVENGYIVQKTYIYELSDALRMLRASKRQPLEAGVIANSAHM